MHVKAPEKREMAPLKLLRGGMNNLRKLDDLSLSLSEKSSKDSKAVDGVVRVYFCVCE